MKVSVVVPVYNASSSLKKCVDSLLSQDFDSMEIILVDDGSVDESGIICDEYAKSFANVLVIHQDNAGPSVARNAGMDIAQGEWITFVDSDDYVDSCHLSSMSNCADKYKADFVFSGLKFFIDSKYNRSVQYNECTYSTSEMEKLFGDIKLYQAGYSVCKLYKKSVVENYRIRFDEKVCIAEDLMFMERYIIALRSMADSVLASCSSTSYNYLLHNDSFSAKCTTYEKEIYSYNAYINSYIALCNTYNLSPDIRKAFDYETVYYMNRVIYSINKINNRSLRLRYLKGLDLELYKKIEIPLGLITKVLRFLLVNKMFVLYDLVKQLILVKKQLQLYFVR